MAAPKAVLPRKFDYSLKIIIVGDSAIGKSCFLIRYVRDTYDEDTQPTLGVEFLTKIIQTSTHRIQLQLWDTAGQELFRSVTSGYYRGSAGAIVMFDVTSRDSFESVSRWIQDIHEVARTNVVTVLVGNKCDLADQRSVTTEEAEAYARERNLAYFETSAKTGVNITEAFEGVVAPIEKNVESGLYKVNIPGENPDPPAGDGGACAC
jgi:small GTP-binding protein